LREQMDFRAVASVGDTVWIAGQPGSVIWRSGDQGVTWITQHTGSPLPIESLAFSSATHGCAVGALGRILRTTDGGTTWETVRGANRRAALLMVHAHENYVSLNLPTKYGQELGYRTMAAVVARRDIGPDGDDGRTLDLRLQEGMTRAGGTGGAVDWAFPIAAPGLERDQAELVREWELLTDKRLREKMLGRLVTLFCTWRPEVVVIDAPTESDTATRLIGDAVQLAVRMSSDPAQYNELHQQLDLPTWSVKKLFRRLPAGSGGAVRLDAFEFLPRCGMSVTMAAAEPYRRLSRGNLTVGRDEAFEPIALAEAAQEESLGARDLFAGLAIAPGSDARRLLGPIDDLELDRLQNLAQQQRNFAAYAKRMLDDPRHAAQLVAQTRDIIGGAPPQQAAVQLLQLAGEYRQRGEWEHAESVLVELAERYPQEPAAVEAMQWLYSCWISAEVGWQRLRASSHLERSRQSNDGAILQANVQRAIEQSRLSDSSGDAVSGGIDSGLSPIRQTSAEGQVRIAGSQGQQAALQQAWLERAERMVKVLREFAPIETQSPAFQFQLAALHRKRNHPRQADEVHRRFLNDVADGPWNRIAAGEIWVTQPSVVSATPVAYCRKAKSPPVLDGILDDGCWRRDSAVRLRNDAEHRHSKEPLVDDPADKSRVRVQWAYDSGFLYIAARVPRDAALPQDRPVLPGRTHDADVSQHDRLSFALDVDRDYATFYEIAVDQRGWTTDACWENPLWNCRRYIAADADAAEWRIEMAIPLEELVPAAPRSGDVWAAGVSRVMPKVGVESWTHPAGSQPRPDGFGLLQFE
ncbi:MAG: hypothetical protein KF861_17995, partial [Planctomycetaceae bacterium]|nr:hypothetical protein [Planctomycetaceae bacterium]